MRTCTLSFILNKTKMCLHSLTGPRCVAACPACVSWIRLVCSRPQVTHLLAPCPVLPDSSIWRRRHPLPGVRGHLLYTHVLLTLP